MSTITFDTLKFVKTLEKAGVPSAQAEAMAEAFRDATGEELVTKTYLDARLEASKNDVIKWVAGMLLAQAALIAALVKLL
ncbi:MAG: CCDC90 family protein [Rhodocyclaceae bacterium]|nr:CCDC90 family protein [Rhodocyclaceae bacterium]